jgi:AraC-like DNA-binding protein
MALRVLTPCVALSPFVEAFWDYDNLTGDQNANLSILPDTATYLCFIYSDWLKTTHKNAVYATRSGLAGFQAYRSDLSGDGVVSGVSARLSPYGLSMFCRGIAKDCAERRVDCRDIFNKGTIERIEEQLSQGKNARERVSYVESFLMSTIKHEESDSLTRAICDRISLLHGNCRISSIGKAFDISKRTLERRFRERVGVTPKTFARVVRLRHAIIQKTMLPHWAEVAQACGYFDQSHMINEFNELYGISPDELYPRVAKSSTFRFSGLLNLNPQA